MFTFRTACVKCLKSILYIFENLASLDELYRTIHAGGVRGGDGYVSWHVLQCVLHRYEGHKDKVRNQIDMRKGVAGLSHNMYSLHIYFFSLGISDIKREDIVGL